MSDGTTHLTSMNCPSSLTPTMTPFMDGDCRSSTTSPGSNCSMQVNAIRVGSGQQRDRPCASVQFRKPLPEIQGWLRHPLSRWRHDESFDSARECNAHREHNFQN